MKINEGETAMMLIKKKVVASMKTKGIRINDSYQKTNRPRGQNVPLYCPFSTCMREFHETGNLKTHLRIHVSFYNIFNNSCIFQTGERPFVCLEVDCGKRFITKGHLKTHELIHSGDKPHVCNFCGKTYSRTGRLKIHLRTHVSETVLPETNLIRVG